ncbi:hypothetical protein M409DRAFT_18937 [Zasmidium cellare ATCC 36951]|uniref:C2H2-type domain-containing protein n=1 Tax=Zasmidium cellare ATCC 36951 TaxID=1080233 RepID=A0A6A6CUW9_ZASCE|nr:uncharacterized protein M409DRAFT_18937 [Zasmidium cellare ATCC 36951]KAF2170967.1 hypothetical protein M409DRAFT_18937 [Zasmidium cellare ATCC 36951]
MAEESHPDWSDVFDFKQFVDTNLPQDFSLPQDFTLSQDFSQEQDFTLLGSPNDFLAQSYATETATAKYNATWADADFEDTPRDFRGLRGNNHQKTRLDAFIMPGISATTTDCNAPAGNALLSSTYQPPGDGFFPFRSDYHRLSARIWRKETLQDSDSSWNEKDEGDEWSLHIQKLLMQFRLQTKPLTTLTHALSSHERKKVHSMCYLMNLSHVSIPDSNSLKHKGPKRMLIAKCDLRTTVNTDVKLWNPRRSGWTTGFVDPFFVVVENSSSSRTRLSSSSGRDVTEALQQAGLPLPIFTEFKWEHTMFLLFDTLSKAMVVLDAIQQGRFTYHGEALTCRYWESQSTISEPIGTVSSSRDGDVGVNEAVMRSRPSFDTSDHHDSETSASASESSADSAFSWVDEDYGTAASSMKKRKRQGKTIGGYPCLADGCFMMFDRECDRKKHAKIHTDERPHACLACGKGFLWPKDLKRHERRHHQGHQEDQVTATSVA